MSEQTLDFTPTRVASFGTHGSLQCAYHPRRASNSQRVRRDVFGDDRASADDATVPYRNFRKNDRASPHPHSRSDTHRVRKLQLALVSIDRVEGVPGRVDVHARAEQHIIPDIDTRA